MGKIRELRSLLKDSRLNTVCQSAKCPNLGRCWEHGTATFMILGDVCTRACRFCAVKTGTPAGVDADEPYRVAMAVKRMRLRYVVVTSVTRDDLDDEGAGHFADTITQIKKYNPDTKIETLIPDFSGRQACLQKVINAGPDVISHNIEMAERLFSHIRPGFLYNRSLDLLNAVRRTSSAIVIKSGFMVGLGEDNAEVFEIISELRAVGCDILAIGQYLAPGTSSRYVQVDRFVSEQEFDEFRCYAERLGFKSVMSAALVRSSFLAGKAYEQMFVRRS